MLPQIVVAVPPSMTTSAHPAAAVPSALTGTAAARPAWHDVPSWALVAEHDNAIPPAGQRWMAERAGARIATVGSSHAVMVAQPEAVTQTVLEAVRGVG